MIGVILRVVSALCNDDGGDDSDDCRRVGAVVVVVVVVVVDGDERKVVEVAVVVIVVGVVVVVELVVVVTVVGAVVVVLVVVVLRSTHANTPTIHNQLSSYRRRDGAAVWIHFQHAIVQTRTYYIVEHIIPRLHRCRTVKCSGNYSHLHHVGTDSYSSSS